MSHVCSLLYIQYVSPWGGGVGGGCLKMPGAAARAPSPPHAFLGEIVIVFYPSGTSSDVFLEQRV